MSPNAEALTLWKCCDPTATNKTVSLSALKSTKVYITQQGADGIDTKCGSGSGEEIPTGGYSSGSNHRETRDNVVDVDGKDAMDGIESSLLRHSGPLDTRCPISSSPSTTQLTPPTKPSLRPKRIVDASSQSSGYTTDDSTTVSSLSGNSISAEEDRRIRSFEYFVNDYVSEQSLHGATKRGKRTNAVNLFSKANSRVFKKTIQENYKLIWNHHNQTLRQRQGCTTMAMQAKLVRHYNEKQHPSLNDANRRISCHVHSSDCLMRQFLNMIHHGTLQAMSRYLPNNLTDEGYISPVHFVFSHVESHILTQLSTLLPPPSLLWNRHHRQPNGLPSPSRQRGMTTCMQSSSLLKVLVWLEETCVEVQKQCNRHVDAKSSPKIATSTSSTTSSTSSSIALSESWGILVTQLWQYYRVHMVQGVLRDRIRRSTQLRCEGWTSDENPGTSSVPSDNLETSIFGQMDDATISTKDTAEHTNKNIDKDICKNEHGELVSGHPEMIMAAVEEQLDTIVDAMSFHKGSTLPTGVKYCLTVWSICLDEVSTMVADFMWHVGTSWKVMTTMRLCSIINDARRLSYLLADRADWMNQTITVNWMSVEVKNGLHFLDEASCDKSNSSSSLGTHSMKTPSRKLSVETTVATTLDVVRRDLTELSWHAIHFLCQRLVYTFLVADPTSALLASVGSPSWEADTNGRAIPRTMNIFRDFLIYVEEWLNPVIIPDVLQKIFDLTLQIYVESFFCNTLRYGVKNAAVVAAHLSQDYLNLVIFFNGTTFQKYPSSDGIFSASTIKTRLLILQSLSRLLNTSIQSSDLKEDAIRLMEFTTPTGNDHLHTNNEAAMLHLAGLRQTCLRSRKERQEIGGTGKPIKWLQMILLARQTLQARPPHDGQAKDPANSEAPSARRSIIQLPDLRNSRFISKMRVGTKELRKISAKCSNTSSLDAMMQLIQPPLAQRNLRDFLGWVN